MAALTSELSLTALVLFIWSLVSAAGQNLLSCETASPDASGYRCGATNKCQTFAILRANSYYSSLSNVSYYLGLDRLVIAEASGFSADTEFLPLSQPLLIPIECKCNGAFYEAALTKTTSKGESFYSISESLEGLTTCEAIREKNPGVSAQNLGEQVKLLVPLRCACANGKNLKAKFLVSYPVSQGDTAANLAIRFNTTPEAIATVNNKSPIVPLTTLLVPLNNKPILDPLAVPEEPYSPLPSNKAFPASKPRKKKSKMKVVVKVYIALSSVIAGLSIAIALTFVCFQLKKKNQDKQNFLKEKDLELQQLSLSVRTTGDKKVSFEGSQDGLDTQMLENTTPRKLLLETYTLEELKKATEDFGSSNHIEGSVYHGLLKGKNLAVKIVGAETMGKVDFMLLNNPTHFHPNIIRLLGTCFNEGGSDGYLVFEYAKNGSLKDWLHSGLAIKNQFIASCYCFLAWNQRLRICLDVALALQHMHQISYVHRNIRSRNIFLDEDFHAKIGNFGMARFVEDKTNEQQTLCSLAPECLREGVLSPSIDIFAYGMVLLEILTGQTPTSMIDTANQEGCDRVSERLKSVLKPGYTDDFREWMDSALGENYSLDAAVALANLARACVEEDPSLRPSASEIVEKISGLVESEDEEEESAEKEHSLISESSCKPLVN